VFHLFGALAEFERSIIKERTMAGLASAKARGRVGGRPRALSAKDVMKAKAMLRDANLSVQEVANTFGVSLSTLYTYLPGGRSSVED
jgi:DNA invertase Pin-like site-specific DNA recombinase